MCSCCHCGGGLVISRIDFAGRGNLQIKKTNANGYARCDVALCVCVYTTQTNGIKRALVQDERSENVTYLKWLVSCV